METPLFVGRAVVALASDPEISAKTGKDYRTHALAREYDFTDVDGRQPKNGSRQSNLIISAPAEHALTVRSPSAREIIVTLALSDATRLDGN